MMGNYAKIATAEAPSGVLTGVERLERLEGFVRRLAKGYHVPFARDDDAYTATDALKEARAIAALLPPPVDPDLLKAREIVEYAVDWSPQTDRDIQSGKNDNTPEVRIALAGIKAGREMGK